MNETSSQDTGSNATMPLPIPQAEPPLLASAPPAQPAPQGQPSEAIGTPAAAADNDVIEKEWVLRAKEVVAATRHDPYKQVQEINKIKADYMKKRYNKVIKLADE